MLDRFSYFNDHYLWNVRFSDAVSEVSNVVEQTATIFSNIGYLIRSIQRMPLFTCADANLEFPNPSKILPAGFAKLKSIQETVQKSKQCGNLNNFV